MADFKPSDVYVGVVELFSVLLPGGLLEAAIVRAALPRLGNPFEPLLSTPETQWVAFAFGAYAIGAIIFPVASLLDESLYDPYRQLLWPKKHDHAYQRATELRLEVLGKPSGEERDIPMNTFAWAKALLILKAPGAFADVQRYEAESKFFRSLVVVLPLVDALLWLAWRPGLAWTATRISVPLIVLCFHRYAERRHKSTEWAYRYVITLLKGREIPAAAAPEAAAA